MTLILNKHCLLCGTAMHPAIPPGDNLPRHICPACGHIHYENPRVIVGCVATWESRILLCRRAIEPRHGFWTLPAGFMENGESTAQGAARETLEEAGAHVAVDAPFALICIPRIHQVHLFYRGHLRTPELAPGEESLEAKLLRTDEIPWSDLAFSSVRFCLERFLADRQSGHFGFHETEMQPGLEHINPAGQSEPAKSA